MTSQPELDTGQLANEPSLAPNEVNDPALESESLAPPSSSSPSSDFSHILPAIIFIQKLIRNYLLRNHAARVIQHAFKSYRLRKLSETQISPEQIPQNQLESDMIPEQNEAGYLTPDLEHEQDMEEDEEDMEFDLNSEMSSDDNTSDFNNPGHLPTWTDLDRVSIDILTSRCRPIPSDFINSLPSHVPDNVDSLTMLSNTIARISNICGVVKSRSITEEKVVELKSSVSIEGVLRSESTSLKPSVQHPIMPKSTTQQSTLPYPVSKSRVIKQSKTPVQKKLPPISMDNLIVAEEVKQPETPTYASLHMRKQSVNAPSPAQTTSSLQKRLSQRKAERPDRLKLVM
ncbi:hypothetical protein RCL1_007106 [Eukaryota sp. TZLM3-RCL]